MPLQMPLYNANYTEISWNSRETVGCKTGGQVIPRVQSLTGPESSQTRLAECVNRSTVELYTVQSTCTANYTWHIQIIFFLLLN